MKETWEKKLSCASQCDRCQKPLQNTVQRILSVYTHEPICMDCKKLEEKQPDYEHASKAMIAACLKETNKPYGEPTSYCFHHFCPFKCK
jgi:hypothetical protein